jgi:predicted nucleic acid-binding Zn ribbon protein
MHLKYKELDMSKSKKKYSKGYWMSVGISIGLAIGVALGPLFGNIGIGIAIGVAIGSGIGTSLERRHWDEVRPLTEAEQRRQKRGIIIGMTITALLLVFLILVYFLQAR